VKAAHFVGRAVSGDRLSQAAKRLQFWMWLRCVCGLSLRAAMSSIIRWRNGLTVSVLLMRSSILSELHDTSILRTGLPARHRYAIGLLQAPRLMPPRSGLERSDFVHWPEADDLGVASSRQLSGVHGRTANGAATAESDPERTFASLFFSVIGTTRELELRWSGLVDWRFVVVLISGGGLGGLVGSGSARVVARSMSYFSAPPPSWLDRDLGKFIEAGFDLDPSVGQSHGDGRRNRGHDLDQTTDGGRIIHVKPVHDFEHRLGLPVAVDAPHQPSRVDLILPDQG
jgi:hypothetical protein